MDAIETVKLHGETAAYVRRARWQSQLHNELGNDVMVQVDVLVPADSATEPLVVDKATTRMVLRLRDAKSEGEEIITVMEFITLYHAMSLAYRALLDNTI